MEETDLDKGAKPRLVVTVSPETVEPGSEFMLAARLEAERLTRVEGEIVFYDAAGVEGGRAFLEDLPGTTRQVATAHCIASKLPGEQTWTARLESADYECEDSLFTVVVAPHPVSITVWDVPPVIECGNSFSLTVGLKCPCGCNASGWKFRILDGNGQEVGTGQVGDIPVAGTTALYSTTVKLTAPEEQGAQEWTVIALPVETDIPHLERRLPIRFHARNAPEITLRIEAVDAKTNTPIPRAKVVVHPYHARTNEDGIAELRVTPGFYTVFVSGSPYFAFKSSGEITGDTELKAELYEDREFSENEAWA